MRDASVLQDAQDARTRQSDVIELSPRGSAGTHAEKCPFGAVSAGWSAPGNVSHYARTRFPPTCLQSLFQPSRWAKVSPAATTMAQCVRRDARTRRPQPTQECEGFTCIRRRFYPYASFRRVISCLSSRTLHPHKSEAKFFLGKRNAAQRRT